MNCAERERLVLASSSRLGLVKRMQEELASCDEGWRRWNRHTRRALSTLEHSMAVSQGGVLGLKAIFILKKGILFPPLSNSFKPPPAQGKFLELYNKDTFRITASFSECFLCKCYIRETSLCFTLQSRFENLQNRSRKRHLENTLSFICFPFLPKAPTKKGFILQVKINFKSSCVEMEEQRKMVVPVHLFGPKALKVKPIVTIYNPGQTEVTSGGPQQGSVKGPCKRLHQKPGCLSPPGRTPVEERGLLGFTVGLQGFLFALFSLFPLASTSGLFTGLFVWPWEPSERGTRSIFQNSI